MLHPLIYQRSHDAVLEHSRASYVIVVIPLLFETNFQSLADRILVVDCPAELQVERLVKRDNIDESLARKMMSQQLSNSERLARAHDIINNGSDDIDLRSSVNTASTCGTCFQLYFNCFADLHERCRLDTKSSSSR
jgi:dephospho-CoA kinase